MTYDPIFKLLCAKGSNKRTQDSVSFTESLSEKKKKKKKNGDNAMLMLHVANRQK